MRPQKNALSCLLRLPVSNEAPADQLRHATVRSSAAEDVVSLGFGVCPYPVDQRRGDLEFLQGCFQVFNERIEVGVVEALGNEVRVTIPNVCAGVAVRACEDLCQESLLLRDLALHVDALEKQPD